MSLRDWLPATATVATTATLAASTLPTVARVATVAVATRADGPAKPATEAEVAELRALVRRVLANCPEEWAEIEAVALADLDDALLSFRALAADLPPAPPDPLPALPTCASSCRNLTTLRDRDGYRRCLAASRRYSPVPDIGRRCENYLPAPDDLDQRTGRSRWPRLDQAKRN
jgi:hypothetical protein